MIVVGARYAHNRARMCLACKGCDGCPLAKEAIWDSLDPSEAGCIVFERDFPEVAARLVEAWAEKHPEE